MQLNFAMEPSTHTLAADPNYNRIFIPVTGSGIQVWAAQITRVAAVSPGRRRQPGYELTDSLRFQLGDCSLSGFDKRFKSAKIRLRVVIQQLAEARQSLRRLEFNQSIDCENPHACVSIT